MPVLQRAHAAPTRAAPVQRWSAPARALSGPNGVFDPVQLERATRLGHHFGRVMVSPPVASPAAGEPIQAREAEERPSGQHLAPAGRGKPLPEAVQTKMEQAFGQDFSGVRIHEGRTAESIGAVAFTRGQDIHFAPGKYSPASRHGQELIGHELTHVVQQRAGRVAMPQGKGAPINADRALEAEADAQGARAARASATVSEPIQSRAAQARSSSSTPGLRRAAIPSLGLAQPESAVAQADLRPIQSGAQVIQPWAWGRRQWGRFKRWFGGLFRNRQNRDQYQQVPRDSETEVAEPVSLSERRRERLREQAKEFKRNRAALLGEEAPQRNENRRSSRGLISEHAPSLTVSPNALSFQGTWSALGEEKWREHVRGQHQRLGRTAYDSEDKDLGTTLAPGKSYSASMMAADKFAEEHLGQPLTVEMYQRMHRLASQHRREISFRNKRSGGSYRGDIGVELLPEHASPEGIEALRASGHMSYLGQRPDSGRHLIKTTPMSEEEVQKALGSIFRGHQDAMKTPKPEEERLMAVARTHQALARLHPFEDANTRTHMLALNKLLTEAGFHPAIVHDPKHVYLKSEAEWKKMISEGMETWRGHRQRLDTARPAGPATSSSANSNNDPLSGSEDDLDSLL